VAHRAGTRARPAGDESEHLLRRPRPLQDREVLRPDLAPAQERGAEPAEEPLPVLVVAGEDDDDEAAEPVERNWLDDLNPESKRVIRAYVEPALAKAVSEERFQFERNGYFIADSVLSKPGKPVFNRTVTLRDSWAK